MQFETNIPIWRQLVDEFARRIASGEWPLGVRVPSVREAAAELGVNPNTVQRGFAELDRLGLTLVERASGRRVTSDPALVERHRVSLAAGAASVYAAQAAGLGLGRAEARRLLEANWSAEDSERGAPSREGDR